MCFAIKEILMLILREHYVFVLILAVWDQGTFPCFTHNKSAPTINKSEFDIAAKE